MVHGGIVDWRAFISIGGCAGKTWTMGSAFTPGGGSRGVIPKVMDTIFSKIEGTQGTDFTVRVGFVEIHTVGFSPVPDR